MPALRQTSATTGMPPALCFRTKAFWASENSDAFMALRSSQPGNRRRRLYPKRSSLAASDHRPQARVLTIVDTFSRFSSASEPRFILRGADVVDVFEGPASV